MMPAERKERDSMKAQPFHVRQGDVMLVRIERIPDGATEVKRDNGRLVLAYGEVTGHAHVLDAPAEDAIMLTVAESATFVRLTKKAQLVHEEHATIDVPAGDYRVVRQREYSPAEIRRVLD